MSTKEVALEVNNNVDYSNVTVDYTSINVPLNPEEIVIQKEILEFVADTIKKIDEEEPDKDYLHIYTLRYDKGMTQKEISQEIGISQSEVSKRLYRLMGLVKDAIE